MTVVTVLRLAVQRGSEDDVKRVYDKWEIFERSRESGGFLGGRLLRPLDPSEPFLVIAEWESRADYQRWLDNPLRTSLGGHLEPLLEGDVPVGAVYETA
jgi:heme-degrading monooxygenase HmoA